VVVAGGRSAGSASWSVVEGYIDSRAPLVRSNEWEDYKLTRYMIYANRGTCYNRTMEFLNRLLKRGAAKESNISRALNAVLKANGASDRVQLRRALQKQRLLLPIQKEMENVQRDRNGRLLQGVQVDFVGFKDANGRKFLAVFTNPDELKKWNPNLPKWIAIDTPSICRLALSSGYAAMKINAGSLPFVELGIKEIEALANLDAGE
jgi:hypothetical protein